MKSLTKPALRAIPAAWVQLSLHVQGVLCALRQAFNGIRVSAGKSQLHTVARASINRGHKREVPLAAIHGVEGSSFASLSLRPALPSTCGRPPARGCRNRARLAPQLRWQHARRARSGGQCVQPACTRCRWKTPTWSWSATVTP